MLNNGIGDIFKVFNNFTQEDFIPIKTTDSYHIGNLHRLFLDQIRGHAMMINGNPLIFKDDEILLDSCDFEFNSRHFSNLLLSLKSDKNIHPKLLNQLHGWRNECYIVYGNNNVPLFELERSAAGIFGIPTFGIHLTAYDNDYNIWIPRSSYNKSTFPGLLDNTVAGGISAGHSIHQTVLKECEEEANLNNDFVKNNVKPAGVLTYYYLNDEVFLQPEIQFIFDLNLPSNVIPKVHDGEVHSFSLLHLNEVLHSVKFNLNDWKPNSALVMIDFLIRHGHLSYLNEPNLLHYQMLSHFNLNVGNSYVH